MKQDARQDIALLPARFSLRRLLLPLRPVTIARREVAVALPPLALLWLIFFLRLVIMIRDDRWVKSGGATNAGLQSLAGSFVTWWLVLAIITAFFLGITAGAEEEETGTANFARRLPIAPLRILAEKLAGSALAFALWTLGTAVMLLIGDALASADLDRVTGEVLRAFQTQWAQSPLDSRTGLITPLPALLWCLWLYVCALAVGSFAGKTLHTAIISGLAAFILVVAANALLLQEFRDALRAGPHPALVLAGSALLILATAIRFLRVEGR